MPKIFKIVDIGQDPNFEPTLMYDINSRQEIVVSLFSECNLKCDFCFQKNIDTIYWSPSNTDVRINLMRSCVPNIPRSKIKVKLAGGELFQNHLIKRGALNDYQRFIDNTIKIIEENNKSYYFSITSNLVFTKYREQIAEFLQNNNIELYASYDFEGRFSSTDIVDRFIDNVEYLNSVGIKPTINFVLTKKAATMLMYQQDHHLVKTFNKLHSTNEVSYEYYTDMNVPQYDLTEKELGEVFIFLYNHYPNVKEIQSLVDPNCDESKYCNSSIWIDTVTLYQCCNHLKYVNEFVDNKQCIMCDFYKTCRMSCPRLYSKQKHCHLKIFYEYCKDHQIISI